MDYAAVFAALDAVQAKQDAGIIDIDAEIEQRATREQPVAYSSVISLVCGLETYERVKELFMESAVQTRQRHGRHTPKQYCHIEEQFAKQTCELLLDHHAQENQRRLSPPDLLDEDPPTLYLIQRLWKEYSANVQQATPSPSPPPSHRISKPKLKMKPTLNTTRKTKSVARPRRPPPPARRTDTCSHVRANLPPSSRTRSKTRSRLSSFG